MAKLAILGGTPVRSEPYPIWPEYDERDLKAVTDVIKSRNWGGFPYPGPRTVEFLQKFAEMQGGGFPVAMANGTVTIEVACRAGGIGWGDEVLVPALTFQATAAAPMAAGAIPVIVDVDPQTYCMDPVKVEKAITPRTRAIIPVHLGAQMTDMDAIMEIAEKHNLIVIEDCAHAHGAKWRGRGAGTIGHFGSFSLQSSKILTTGEGGVLLCRTAEYAETAASIINCGRPMDEKHQHYTMGANYRMAEIQAALGVVALERFPEQSRQRNETALYLEECLSEVPGVRLLRHDPRLTNRSAYIFGFAIDPAVFGNKRDVVCAALDAEGIPAEPGYPPMNRYDLFNPLNSRLPVPSAFPEYFDMSKVSLPQAEKSADEGVFLGENVLRSGNKGVEDVVKGLLKVQENAKELAAAARERGYA